jgi:plasmid maintenance system antidote protein VapI
MNNLINELAGIDIELADARHPNALGQTPEFWKLVENRVKLQSRIERAAFDERMNKIVE